jgi:type IV fimbrial biogenesis protein FimT
MSLIELLIGLVLVGVLLGLGVPNFSAWLQNIQVRGAAEAIFNGLQTARANAVQRNKQVQLRLTGPGAVLGQFDASWAVTEVVAGTVIQSRSGADGTRNAVVTTNDSTVIFDGLGATTLAAAALIQVTNPTGGTCQPGGKMRCLNVTVSVGGQIKMCDPHPSIGTGDSRHC